MHRATRFARLTRPRLLSPLASAARDLSTAASPGFFELRTDRVLPGALDSYLREQKRTAAARQKIFPGCFFCDEEDSASSPSCGLIICFVSVVILLLS